MRVYQPILCMFAAICVFACQSVAGADVPLEPLPQVQIQVKLTETMPDGKQAVLCEPCVVTTLGTTVPQECLSHPTM
jgi:hypothetical protein